MPQPPLILLVVCGSVSAYKALYLARLVLGAGLRLRVIITSGGQRFVTPESFLALGVEAVHTDHFSGDLISDHIALARQAALIVVAPATANMIARMAGGLADDLATTILLASRVPVLVCPAMNSTMWEHPATLHNAGLLRERGVFFCGPAEGEFACGEAGAGRLSEPDIIFKTISSILQQVNTEKLPNIRAFVTAGGTIEPIDPVRYIGNYSSGRQGVAIANYLAQRGVMVDLLLAQHSAELVIHHAVRVHHVQHAAQMLAQLQQLAGYDLGFFCAAVADWRVAEQASQKISKKDVLQLNLVPNPDIAAEICGNTQLRPKIAVGFAAETSDSQQALASAQSKLQRKGFDLLYLNNVLENNIFGSEYTAGIIISHDNTQHIEPTSKAELAHQLCTAALLQLQQLKQQP